RLNIVLEQGGKLQEKIAENKISDLHDPKKLDQVMKSIFNRTFGQATPKDTRVFLTAYSKRLGQLLTELEGLTA
ncbi:MAG: hypothetical protein ACP5VS_18790, partial [Desulfomonilaceae bacterium]